MRIKEVGVFGDGVGCLGFVSCFFRLGCRILFFFLEFYICVL